MIRLRYFATAAANEVRPIIDCCRKVHSSYVFVLKVRQCSDGQKRWRKLHRGGCYGYGAVSEVVGNGSPLEREVYIRFIGFQGLENSSNGLGLLVREKWWHPAGWYLKNRQLRLRQMFPIVQFS